jgi:16S rRNA (adenine1518-N6/adenine1519-N6)-dimethyltransferase
MDPRGIVSHPSTLLKDLEQRAKKRFGQHFLVSPGVVRQILMVADLAPGARVLEIGPGLGVLTEALLGAGTDVTAVELDRDMAAFIRDRLPGVNLIEGDGARVDFSEVLAGGPWRCVSNLPYNAGTKMITRMLQQPERFDRLVVMVQREVAERLVAVAGDRRRGSLSIFTEARAEAKIRIRVPPGAFHPAPKVHSAVVELRLRPQAEVGEAPIEFFDIVVRALFVQPRKTLRNNLATMVDRGVVDEALDGLSIDARRRPSTLELSEVQGIAGALYRHSKG